MGESELERAIDAVAAELAPALIAEARADAAAEVREALAQRFAAALRRRCDAELTGSAPRPEPRRERPAPANPPRTAAKAPPAQPRLRAQPDPHPSAEPHPLAERARESARGHYVYGVIAAGSRLPEGLAGVDPDLGVRLVEAHGLAAIASEVPLSEFGEDSIREHLEDVAWLEEKARAHEDVLEAALAAATVVPLRLCTVFASEAEVREMLGRERGVLRDALARLAGKAEWGVKAYAEGEALAREAAARAGDGEEDDELPAGVAYMNRKRRAAREREEAEEVADEWARRIHERLSDGAEEALLNPLQRPELSGHEAEMLLNGVYLVADGEAGEFGDLAAGLRDEFDRRGVEVVLTGPWPAYNFVKGSIEAAR